MKTLIFHTDPGHGWMEFPTIELIRAGLDRFISGYSYMSQDGKTSYLEEDSDAPKVLHYLKTNSIEFKIEEKHTDQDSFIRNLPVFRR